MANTSIIAANKKFECGARVILWNEEEGISFYPGGPWSKGRYTSRNLNLKELQKIIKAIYIHHSVTYHAHSTFRVLRARNLSCNFIIDDDINEDTGCATIYQMLDIKDAGWSQGGDYNRSGAGIEISYYPDAWDHPNRYSFYNRQKWGVREHDIVSDEVRGHKFSKVFAPTDAQVKACIHLMYGYKKAFPDIELKFPRDTEGNFLSKTVDEHMKHGLLHHFNITTRKIDALGFPTDFAEHEVNRMHREEPLKRKNILKKLFKWLPK